MNKLEKTKILTSKLPPRWAIGVYSLGRQIFMHSMKAEIAKQYVPSPEHSLNLWDIDFRAPLFNAAGMFKDFSCYELAFNQGAGAYLVGTLTAAPREGNIIDGIYLPFTIYPKSHTASNSLGLPNNGAKEILNNIPEKRNGFPIGVSLASDSLEDLIGYLKLYEQKGIDFVEINESCPNVDYSSMSTKRLETISGKFLRKRKRNMPVIVKLSNDFSQESIQEIIDMFIVLGYDGVNFGNTSTDYARLRNMMHPSELKLFDYYVKNFAGGVSGRVLKESSLKLAALAAEYVNSLPLEREFHVIRTGGIETQADVEESKKEGILLNEWYTGYFEKFVKDKNSVYKNIFE